jgi:hypothetical protein
VRVVGNSGRLNPPITLFSKFAHLHSPVLENSPPTQPLEPKPFHPSFHFSFGNYGYYYLFS